MIKHGTKRFYFAFIYFVKMQKFRTFFVYYQPITEESYETTKKVICS